VSLRSGKDLHRIRDLSPTTCSADWNGMPAAAGDWNEDGVPDVALCGMHGDTPVIVIVSGKDGKELQAIACEGACTKELFTHRGTTAIVSSCRSGDMRRASFVLPAGHPERTLLVTPGVAAPIALPYCERDRDAWVNHEASFVGDVDGDGVPDVALATFAEPSGNNGGNAPRCLLLSGKSGARIDVLEWEAGFDGGCSATRIADVDGDCVEEILIGVASWPEGRALIRSGKDRRLLWIIKQREGCCSEEGRFAASVTALGDVDGDGVADFAIGSSTGADRLDPGCVAVFSGKTRQRLRSLWKDDLVRQSLPDLYPKQPK
jgi:hypothetical protein